MSIVKAKLQEQNAEFISIREVVELLSREGDGCTKEEAVQYLLQRLQAPGAPRPFWKAVSGWLHTTPHEIHALLISASRSEFWIWEDNDIPF